MTVATVIRTSSEGTHFGLWRDPNVLERLAHPQLLTTARYEPTFRRNLGSGHIDLLFENERESYVLCGIRLDGNNLLTRERSPLVWPRLVADVLPAMRLHLIEEIILPWLRALARGRSMVAESIRRFTPSERFNRARRAELVGAAPLARSMIHMAPFVYARRFAANARVAVACADAPLAQAVLADMAASIVQTEMDVGAGDDDAFARSWYGVASPDLSSIDEFDVVLTNRHSALSAKFVIETSAQLQSSAEVIDVPEPAPHDLLFTFDPADAPAVARFGVYAAEPPMRDGLRLPVARAFGGSSGNIVLAMSNEARQTRGADLEEVEIFGRRLVAEGFSVTLVSDPADPALGGAQLIHIFGMPFDAHMVNFGEYAHNRAIDFVFDILPIPERPSAFVENILPIIYRAAIDDAELARYVKGFEDQRLESQAVPVEPTPEVFARTTARFGQLAHFALAVLLAEEDREVLLGLVPPSLGDRTVYRGVFAEPEPTAARIGHIAPSTPFALVHAVIAAQSHALFTAIATELHKVPVVIVGAVADVDYLQTLRAAAPNAIVLTDAAPAIISTLYRCACVYVDAAPRPRSAAPLLRAVAGGALPVLAANSPLLRMTGDAAPSFAHSSVDDCGRTIARAMSQSDRFTRVETLRMRLLPRRDPAYAFGTVIAAYSRAEKKANA